ncbi:MAG: hypothetical protein IJI43_03900 [Bacilli bacterium]|nr:hypothetical protein [Bacilli bacterium]
MKNKKIIIALVIILLLIIVFVCIKSFSKTENNSKKEKEKVDPTPTNVIEEIEFDSTDVKEFVDNLLKEDSTEFDINNQEINSKYQALMSLIHWSSINSIKEIINKNDIFKAITYDIHDNDITEIKTEENSIIGSIKKETINKQIKNLFCTSKIKIALDKNDEDIIVSEGDMENTSQKYRHASLKEVTDNSYVFEFGDYEGTYAAPILKPFPNKIVSIKEYNDYLLVESRHIYSLGKERKEDSWIVKICSDRICTNVIDEVSVPVQHYFSVNIDKYIDKAEKIYTVFKKHKGHYYFYKNYIENK